MKFKVGDRVKFLTEVGQGIIRSIIGPMTVSVETEDGFEIPTLTSDLVKIDAKTPAEKLFVDDMELQSDDDNVENAPIIEQDAKIDKSSLDSDNNSSRLIVYPSDRQVDKFHISIAFAPQNQQMPLIGDIDIYLMNFSSNDIIFSMHSAGENEFSLLSSAKVEAFTKFYITTITREEIEEYTKAQIQVLVLQHQSKVLRAPVSTDMSIKGSRFYKESAYKDDAILHQKALIYKLIDFKNIPILDKLGAGKEDDVVHTQKARIYEKNDEIIKHKKNDNEAIVDMHIWELVDDHSRMSNSEMLNIQLAYFEKCLQSAIDNHITKVVFIHGVGTGRLKQEITSIMDERDFLSYKPANMSEYGVGATQVDIMGTFS
ncbi:MAG: DUF2027 domain-containing protein [Bacteroidales bacterium]|nr:DUF2027 domain-containing protein [Bacteroidales bacterium]